MRYDLTKTRQEGPQYILLGSAVKEVASNNHGLSDDLLDWSRSCHYSSMRVDRFGRTDYLDKDVAQNTRGSSLCEFAMFVRWTR